MPPLISIYALYYIYIFSPWSVWIMDSDWLVAMSNPFNAQVGPSQFNYCSILMHCFNWCTLTNTHHLRARTHTTTHTHTHTHTHRERERSEIVDFAAHTHKLSMLHYIPQQRGDQMFLKYFFFVERHAAAASKYTKLSSLSLSLSLDWSIINWNTCYNSFK